MMICLKFINTILYGPDKPIPANLCLMVLKEGQPCENLPISANLRSAAREFHSEALNNTNAGLPFREDLEASLPSCCSEKFEGSR